MMKCSLRLILFGCLLAGGSAITHAADFVEFLSGARAQGRVVEIRKANQEFDFEVTLGGQTLVRTYAFSRVHAVTIRGKRHVITEHSTAAGSSDVVRSRAAVLALIDAEGSRPPEWFDSTPLDIPPTLDVAWPLKPPGEGWQNRVNIGQYLWDIINPNPTRWQNGVRLIYHELDLHQNDAELLERDKQTLARMYFQLFQDYVRAAYWYRQVRDLAPRNKIALAECYWRLGNRAMALELLKSRTLPIEAIKLYGDMGETDQAIRLANVAARADSVQPHWALLLGGDACRQASRYDLAIDFYERVLAAGEARNQDYSQRLRGRAQDSIDAIRLLDQADVGNVADGTYTADSIGYNGPVEVAVSVSAGQLTDVEITEHKEKQFYAALTDTPNQILAQQSIQGIDGTSGATITSQAIVNASAKALAKGAQ